MQCFLWPTMEVYNTSFLERFQVHYVPSTESERQETFGKTWVQNKTKLHFLTHYQKVETLIIILTPHSSSITKEHIPFSGVLIMLLFPMPFFFLSPKTTDGSQFRTWKSWFPNASPSTSNPLTLTFTLALQYHHPKFLNSHVLHPLLYSQHPKPQNQRPPKLKFTPKDGPF